jgi:hypothetical protein
MTWGYVAVAGATLVGGYMASKSAKDAANTAANAQTSSAMAGVAEQQRQFDEIQKLLAPYNIAGTASLNKQGQLLGLSGNQAQQDAINSIKNSSMFNELAKQGETGILQNASATGGLRGGNVQAALAQYRPNMLNNLIQQQYSNLAGITSLGQNAAALQGNAGMQTGTNVANLLGQAGAAQAGGALAAGKANSNFYGNMTNLLGMYAANMNSGGGASQTSASSGGGGGGSGGLLGGLLGGGGGGILGGLF